LSPHFLGEAPTDATLLKLVGSALPAVALQKLLFVVQNPVFQPQKEHYLSGKHLF
jgi:hypothetical protein